MLNRYTFTLQPCPPFDLAATTESQPYYRPYHRTGEPDHACGYRRLLDLGEVLALASVEFKGDVNRPELSVDLQGESLTEAQVRLAAGQLDKLLGARQDLLPFYQFTAADPVMARLVETFYGMHQTLALSVFETIAQAILGQQLSASVARVIRALLVENYGPSLVVDGETHHAFPRPETIAGASVEELRSLKLSWRKAEYLRGLAEAELSVPGSLNWIQELSDEDAVREVTSIRGVGQWSAQWVLSRALGRPDAFPVGDLALRRIVSQLYFGGEPISDRELAQFSERWSPYRSLATSYLFAALRTGRGQEAN